MKYLVLIVSFFVLSNTAFSQKNKKIFNGKDLSGWTTYGTEKWYVENGELVCESGSEKKYGYLSTNRPYKNFLLNLKFKLESNGNSGVFIRSTLNGTSIKGWQVEVAPQNLHTGGIYESISGGRGWIIKPKPEDEKNLNPDGWNNLRILAESDEITTWLNGKQMVNLTDEKIGAGEGNIALQIHSGGGIKVRWKDIRVKELK